MCVYVYMCVYIYIYTYHILFIRSSIDGHLDCLHVLAIVNNVAVKVELPIIFFSGSDFVF